VRLSSQVYQAPAGERDSSGDRIEDALTVLGDKHIVLRMSGIDLQPRYGLADRRIPCNILSALVVDEQESKSSGITSSAELTWLAARKPLFVGVSRGVHKMSEFSGQTIIITGAGAGIGRALAIGFAGLGAHVVAISRSARGLQETRERCAGSGTVECHAADVTDASGLEGLFGRIVEQRGAVDLLINNAAVYPHQVLAEMTPEEWTAGVATNLSGVVFGCRAAVRTFPAGRAALIINVGSFAHLGPDSGSTLYCTTKAAVSAFTRAIAAELVSMGSPLIVNEWIPGVFRTQMSGNTGEDPNLAFERLLTVCRLSKLGSGGRTFAGDAEHLPQRSLRSRVKSRVKSLFAGRK
jgi:NAD(P)-dependent dehydrogenase (short-subunit alcohol dehydrogenase family)